MVQRLTSVFNSGTSGTSGVSPTPSYKNKIINGNFDVWQRGTSDSTSNEYVTDRWYVQSSGSTHNASQHVFTAGQTAVPNNPRYALKVGVNETAGSAYYSYAVYKVEDVYTFAGETITMSFYAKASASLDMSVEYVHYFGSGGSSTVTGIGITKHSLSTTWAKYTATVTIPSISGKTVNDGSYLQIRFWFDAGSAFDGVTDSIGHQTGSFYLSQVQVESGSVATDFEIRQYAQELVLCQRYFEVMPTWYTPCVYYTTSRIYMGKLSYKVTKRDTPTLTLTVPKYKIDTGSFVDCSSASGFEINTNTFGIYLDDTVLTPFVLGDQFYGYVNLIEIDADF